MSSYPGTITSGDNFIVADSGLVVTDTTIEMVSFLLFSFLTHPPESRTDLKERRINFLFVFRNHGDVN